MIKDKEDRRLEQERLEQEKFDNMSPEEQEEYLEERKKFDELLKKLSKIKNKSAIGNLQ